jgi:pimeloyl-ACP methyl ester carboxylesterase
VYEPRQFDAVTAPTLFLAGSASPADLSEATRRAADAIPAARIRVLEGHAHMAHKSDPAMVASIIRQFILS